MFVKISQTHNLATSHTEHLESLFSIIKDFFSQKSQLKSNHGKTFDRFLDPLRSAWVQNSFTFIEILFCTKQPYFREEKLTSPPPPQWILQAEGKQSIAKTCDWKKKRYVKMLQSAQYYPLIARITWTR